MSFEELTDKRVWRKAMLHLKRNDKVLSRLIKRIGYIDVRDHVPGPYASLMQAFIYQQISGKAADAIIKKFRKLYGGKIPTPKQFLSTSEKKVRAAGISPQKYSYMKDLCERIENKQLDLDGLKKLPNEEIIAVLDEVKGIGRWTAEMFLMFNLRRVDVFAMDDLGLQNAIKGAYKLRQRPSKAFMEKISKNWVPYRSIAALYLWRSHDDEASKSQNE